MDHTQVHVHMPTCTDTRACTHTDINAHTDMQAHTYTQTSACMHTDTHAYTDMRAHTGTYMHTQIHVHTPTHRHVTFGRYKWYVCTCLHTDTCTKRTQTYMHTQDIWACVYTQTGAHAYTHNTDTHPHTDTCAHTYTQTCARTHTDAHAHAQDIGARAYTRRHVHMPTCTNTCM